jgi:hypothetical protein
VTLVYAEAEITLVTLNAEQCVCDDGGPTRMA